MTLLISEICFYTSRGFSLTASDMELCFLGQNTVWVRESPTKRRSLFAFVALLSKLDGLPNCEFVWKYKCHNCSGNSSSYAPRNGSHVSACPLNVPVIDKHLFMHVRLLTVWHAQRAHKTTEVLKETMSAFIFSCEREYLMPENLIV